MKYIINENGVDREMTDQEIEIFTDWQKIESDEMQVQAAAKERKEAAKASAIAKLAALGLTEDEAKAIIG